MKGLPREKVPGEKQLMSVKKGVGAGFSAKERIFPWENIQYVKLHYLSVSLKTFLLKIFFLVDWIFADTV